jgi:GDPmannose 4,6-dehydratase
MDKVALITGRTGKDGTNLEKWLLEKGYTVPDAPLPKSVEGLTAFVRDTQPDEIYNLAAANYVLEAVQEAGCERRTKIYQASGFTRPDLYQLTVYYREAYGLFACNGVLFNQASARHEGTFAAGKIAQEVAAVSTGLRDKLMLGNLGAQRIWGHAGNYVKAMWMVLQQDFPEDHIITTGITATVRDFLQMAFSAAGVRIAFEGEGVHEKGYVVSGGCLPEGQEILSVDPACFQPLPLRSQSDRYHMPVSKLAWEPAFDLPVMIREMMGREIAALRQADPMLRELLVG